MTTQTTADVKQPIILDNSFMSLFILKDTFLCQAAFAAEASFAEQLEQDEDEEEGKFVPAPRFDGVNIHRLAGSAIPVRVNNPHTDFFIKCDNKLYQVMFVALSVKEGNDFMEANPESAMMASLQAGEVLPEMHFIVNEAPAA